MSCEVHNKKFQDELGQFKRDTVPVKNNSHQAFIERLKKQVSTDEPSSDPKDADVCDDAFSEELLKELEAKFDELFANLDDNDD